MSQLQTKSNLILPFFSSNCKKFSENYISLFVWLKNVAARKQKKQTQKVSVSLLSASDCYISRKGLEAFPAIPCCDIPAQPQMINPNWVVCEEIPF